MLNLNRRDRPAESPDSAKTVLKPAIYDPPGTATGGGGARPVAPGSNDPAAQRTAPPSPPPAAAPASAAAPAAKPAGEQPESRLFVGVNIKLKGVEITDCDSLVIEGQVEATVNSKAMEIAKPGTLRGTAQIETAEVHGEFVGELTARTRLIVHGTGCVSGTIRYGKLIVAEGGEVTGDVKRLDEGEAGATSAAAAGGQQATRAALSPSAERWSN
ncbi:MAG: polymer-forming cytoskeletal protein [Burkholderiales bacterium]